MNQPTPRLPGASAVPAIPAIATTNLAVHRLTAGVLEGADLVALAESGPAAARSFWAQRRGMAPFPADAGIARELPLVPGDWDRSESLGFSPEGALSGKYLSAFPAAQHAFVDQLFRCWLADLAADMVLRTKGSLVGALEALSEQDLNASLASRDFQSITGSLASVMDIRPLLDLKTTITGARANGKAHNVSDDDVRRTMYSVPLAIPTTTFATDTFATVVLLRRASGGKFDVVYAFGAEPEFRVGNSKEKFRELAGRVTPLREGKTNLLDEPLKIGQPKVEKGNGAPFDGVIQISHVSGIPELLLAFDIPDIAAEDFVLPLLQNGDAIAENFKSTSSWLAEVLGKLFLANSPKKVG